MRESDLRKHMVSPGSFVTNRGLLSFEGLDSTWAGSSSCKIRDFFLHEQGRGGVAALYLNLTVRTGGDNGGVCQYCTPNPFCCVFDAHHEGLEQRNTPQHEPSRRQSPVPCDPSPRLESRLGTAHVFDRGSLYERSQGDGAPHHARGWTLGRGRVRQGAPPALSLALGGGSPQLAP